PLVRRLEVDALAIVEAKPQAVAGQQHQFPVDAGEARERSVLLDLRDGQPPVPRVAIAVAADLARPAQLIAPALAAILVGGDDTGCGGHGRCGSVGPTV